MQHKVLKTFRWASNASSSFCCSMHLPEETIDGAVAAKSTTIKSQEELPDIVELLLLLPMVIFIKWTNFFMTLLFQFSASAMHQKAGSSKAARCCNLSVDFKHLGMTQYNSSSSRASSRRVSWSSNFRSGLALKTHTSLENEKQQCAARGELLNRSQPTKEVKKTLWQSLTVQQELANTFS